MALGVENSCISTLLPSHLLFNLHLRLSIPYVADYNSKHTNHPIKPLQDGEYNKSFLARNPTPSCL